MDRDLDALMAAPPVSRQRLWLAFGVAATVLTAGSLSVRTFADPGRLAGRTAVIDKGPAWVRSEVDVATGTALGACDALQREYEARHDLAEYDPESHYASFVTGCGQAVDDLLGRHIPLLPPGD